MKYNTRILAIGAVTVLLLLMSITIGTAETEIQINESSSEEHPLLIVRAERAIGESETSFTVSYLEGEINDVVYSGGSPMILSNDNDSGGGDDKIETFGPYFCPIPETFQISCGCFKPEEPIDQPDIDLDFEVDLDPDELVPAASSQPWDSKVCPGEERKSVGLLVFCP